MHPRYKKKKRVVRKKKTTVVVGNLPVTCNGDDLRILFSNYGEVTECEIINTYGFVRMKTLVQVQEAVRDLNNYNFNGFCISVEIAKSKLVTAAKPTAKASSVVFNSNLQKFAFHKLVMHLVSRPNIAAFLSVSPVCYDYEKEFEKFLDFIESLEGLRKYQLTRAIFPLFIHFYLNMVGDRKKADIFYRKFVHIFRSSKDYKDVLIELNEIKNKEDIEGHPYFKIFRIRKYVLRISPSVLKELKCFLKGIDSKALTQALTLSFYYEESDVEVHSDTNPKKKAKKTKRSNQLTQLNYYAIGAKKNTTAKKKSIAKDLNSMKKPKSDCSAFGDLIKVADYDPPILRTAVEWFGSDVYAMDFNQDLSELCISFGDPCIFISSLEDKYISGNMKDKLQEELMEFFPESESDDDSDDEEEISGKKVFFLAPVRAVKYFPNQPYLLLAASGTEIAKVNTAAESVTSFGSGHVSEIWDIDINSTSSLFSSASHDMTCRLWNIEKSSLMRIYAGHKNIVTTVKFHPNGIYLLSGSKDYDVRIWNIENGTCLRCLVDHKAPVTLLTCSPDKKTIASADSDGVVKLWDIQDNLRICDIQCYKDHVYDGSKITSMCFSDEYFLGLCNSRGVVRIWDIRQPNIVFKKTYSDHIPVLLKTIHLGTWSVILRKREDDMEY